MILSPWSTNAGMVDAEEDHLESLGGSSSGGAEEGEFGTLGSGSHCCLGGRGVVIGEDDKSVSPKQKREITLIASGSGA